MPSRGKSSIMFNSTNSKSKKKTHLDCFQVYSTQVSRSTKEALIVKGTRLVFDDKFSKVISLVRNHQNPRKNRDPWNKKREPVLGSARSAFNYRFFFSCFFLLLWKFHLLWTNFFSWKKLWESLDFELSASENFHGVCFITHIYSMSHPRTIPTWNQ